MATRMRKTAVAATLALGAAALAAPQAVLAQGYQQGGPYQNQGGSFPRDQYQFMRDQGPGQPWQDQAQRMGGQQGGYPPGAGQGGMAYQGWQGAPGQGQQGAWQDDRTQGGSQAWDGAGFSPDWSAGAQDGQRHGGYQPGRGGQAMIMSALPPSQALRRLQDATQDLREAVQTIAQEPSGTRRNEAMATAERAILETQEAMVLLPPELRRGPTYQNAQRDLDQARKVFRSAMLSEGQGGWGSGLAAGGQHGGLMGDQGVLVLLVEHNRQQQAMQQIRQSLQQARTALRQGDTNSAEQALAQADDTLRQANAPRNEQRIAHSLDQMEAALQRNDRQAAQQALQQARLALHGGSGSGQQQSGSAAATDSTQQAGSSDGQGRGAQSGGSGQGSGAQAGSGGGQGGGAQPGGAGAAHSTGTRGAQGTR